MTTPTEKEPEIHTSAGSIGLALALLLASVIAVLVAIPKLSMKGPVREASRVEAATPPAPPTVAPIPTSHDPRRISEKGD